MDPQNSFEIPYKKIKYVTWLKLAFHIQWKHQNMNLMSLDPNSMKIKSIQHNIQKYQTSPQNFWKLTKTSPRPTIILETQWNLQKCDSSIRTSNIDQSQLNT